MQAGKLSIELLSNLLDKVNIRDPRVFLGPRVGEDAALLDFGDRYLVAKTDPITFASDFIGWYLVQVNANDIAVMGATPRWLMVTLLLPEGTRQDDVEYIFDQLLEACDALDITLVGGHTEVTYGLPRPIAIGAMLGEVAKDSVVLTSGAKLGDSLVLSKGIAIEGTSLLAREAPEALRAAGISSDLIERSKDLLLKPGISVVRDAAIARDTIEVHAMHDPTEGGLATGLMEMAISAGVGLTIEADLIPMLPECKTISTALGLNPLGLIASGALLIAVAPGDVPSLIEALAKENISACEIGCVTPLDDGIKIRNSGDVQDLPTFERDELARFFGN
uniref:Hydrogenase maturation factor n=1 Tax=uncultured Chloroflexi bacterium HF0500_03M05 TaxID=710737 RepID=E0XY73_9CHLR|nr:hydrogenase maturation factor [uncultured Chloroflexi bacterium HF0500_03M05]